MLRPWGNKPVDTDQLKRSTPPAAAMVWEYVAPIVPSVKAVVVIDRRGGGGAALLPPQLVMEEPKTRATATPARETTYWNLQETGQAVRIGPPLGKSQRDAGIDQRRETTSALVDCVKNIMFTVHDPTCCASSRNQQVAQPAYSAVNLRDALAVRGRNAQRVTIAAWSYKDVHHPRNPHNLDSRSAEEGSRKPFGFGDQ